MPQLKVIGKRSLQGNIKISGAKNAVLPQMAASLLTKQKVTLTNVPDITDVGDMMSVLQAYGVRVEWDRRNKTLELTAESPTHQLPETNVGEKIRASFLVLGPLLAREREANVYHPGGCSLQRGGRPVDFHIKAIVNMKAERIKDKVSISMKVKGGLRPGIITFEKSSVGATETVMMAASLVEGETVIRHAAIEPEIYDLKKMLTSMGAVIKIEEDVKITEDITQFGITEQIEEWNVITIEGRKSLEGVTHKVMPDRIEFGTYAIAAAMNNGKIQLVVEENMKETMLRAIRQPLRDAGVQIDEARNGIVEISLENDNISPVDIQTGPYPAFPTDLLPQWVTFMTQAQPTGGKRYTTIHEKIFNDRLKFVDGLTAMKAKIKEIDDEEHRILCIHAGTISAKVKEINDEEHRILCIQAGKALEKATVTATDLRGGAALVLAGLVAEGSTVVQQYEHVQRGYEDMVGKLNACGAKLKIHPPSSTFCSPF